MLAYISAGLDKKQSYGGKTALGDIISCQNLKYVDFLLSQSICEGLPLALGEQRSQVNTVVKFIILVVNLERKNTQIHHGFSIYSSRNSDCLQYQPVTNLDY